MRDCLGDVVAALVDGELDHAARERAQRHLAHCATCRTEVEGQRRLKARLTGLGAEAYPPGPALTGRLLGLAVPGSEPLRSLPAGPVRPRSFRPTGRASAGTRPPGRRLRRRSAVGGALVVLGLTAAFALGGPPPQPPSTPLDPGTDAFVTEFVSTTNDGPVPTRQASLTGGGR